MNTVPAAVAGVPRIALATPPGALERSPVLAAAVLAAGVHEVYRIGGAQAIAAFALGTASVRPVNKVVGPGNAYVAEAKRQLGQLVGTDAFAGPSEVVVLADETARADWVAADLLAQAEHGSGEERAILVTTSRELAEAAAAELVRQAEGQPNAKAIARALARHGAAVLVEDLDEAVEVAEEIAPEHLEVMTRDPEALAGRFPSAAAVSWAATRRLPPPTTERAPITSCRPAVPPVSPLRSGSAISSSGRASSITGNGRSRRSGAISSALPASRDSRLTPGPSPSASRRKTPWKPVFPANRNPVESRFRYIARMKPVPLDAIRPEVLELAPDIGSRPDVPIYLDWNESRWPLPEGVLTGMADAIAGTDARPYPDRGYPAVREAIARLAGWTPDGVAFGNGGDDMLELMGLATTGTGRRALYPSPGFSMYPWAVRLAGGEPSPVSLCDDLSYDVPEFLRRIEAERPSLVFITNPHNPTGQLLPLGALRELAAAAPGFLLVDEAYHEFSGADRPAASG